MCESRGGRPGLPVPNSPYGLRGRKATLNERVEDFRVQELCQSRGGRPGLHRSYSLRGRKATLNKRAEDFRAQGLCKSRGGCPGLQYSSLNEIVPMISVDVKQH